MRLLILDQFSDLGGAQQCLLELLPAIRARGWQARIGLPGSGEMFQRVRGAGFEAVRIECGPYTSGRKSAADIGRFVRETPRLARQIRALARETGAELIYINGPRLLPGAAMAGSRTPVLFHSHSFLGAGVVSRLAGTSLRRMRARVVASCRYVAGPWRRYVEDERITVVYNGVAGPSSIAHGEARTPTVGCIGRIAPEKGQLEFLEAAKRIHAALPECRFAIYGASLFADEAAALYEQRVRAAAAGLPVDFAGWVANPYSALANLDVLLVPSAAHEATTRVILEAFAAGVPVIAFPSGGIPEIVDHGRTGFLVDGASAMAEMTIELLAGDPARRRAVSEAAAESWRRRFTVERYRDQVMEAMERAAPGA